VPPLSTSSFAPGATAAVGAAALSAPWWGRFAMEEGQGGVWELGPLTLAVERRAREWRVSWATDPQGDEPATRLAVRCPLPASELPSGTRTARFAVHATTPELALEPVLPDRPVVARPEPPLNLLAGEEVALYVALPVWVRILVAGERALVEVPAQRLADTWFGPSTLAGELCYATRTSAGLQPANLPAAPHLATCRVLLTNRAASPLPLERLALPVHHLDLWWHRERGLWTRGLAVERAADGSLASLRLADGPPDSVHGAEQVTPARQPEPRLALVRALEALLG